MVFTSSFQSPLGNILLAEKDNALIGLWFEGQKYYGSSLKEELKENDSSKTLTAARLWLSRYFAGEKPDIGELPLAPAGSDFRREVWGILCRIPYGSVITYGDIAKQLAAQNHLSHMSAQAVGGAVGHNPISVIIPCHRVVGSNGSLTGYAGGIGKKIRLLRHEGVDTGSYFIPKKGTAL